ncbi:MAG: hypothetical protein NVS2B16_35280 [Chloroflexota bacterium]
MRLTDPATGLVAEAGTYHVDQELNLAVPSVTSSSDASHLFLWVYTSQTNTGTAPYTASSDNFMLSTDQGYGMPTVAAAPNGSNGVVLTAQVLSHSQYANGWLGFYLPYQDGAYVLHWNETGGVSLPIAWLKVIASTKTVVVLGQSAVCATLMAPGPISTPTPVVTPTTHPTFAYGNPTPTPVPVYIYPTPPPTYCVPKEGDGDNDDNGKPAASWDKDGCP